MGTLSAAALNFARRGFAVFPCVPRDKKPTTAHGFKDATDGLAAVESWWKHNPKANIGVATGELSGVLVLDVDNDKEGETSLAALVAKHGPLPATVESITGRGRHLWFKYPAGAALGCTAGRLGRGLDTRGNDGYVVAPPSIHPSGKVYSWSVDSAAEFAEMPDWLVELLLEPDTQPVATAGQARDRQELAAQLPQRLVLMLTQSPRKGDRSEISYNVMCELFEHGLSDLDVQMLADGAPFAEKFWKRGDLADECTRAYGKWQRKGGKPKRAVKPAGPAWHETGFTAAELRTRTFPPVQWIVPALIPEGLTLLAGKPKIGKSWLALDLCLGIAGESTVMGGAKPAYGDVLYCALEDNPRRLQKRVDKLLSPYGEAWPDRLRLHTAWRRLDKGGIDDLDEWCDSVERPMLIVLDTLAGVRPVKTEKGYAEDYEALAGLHQLANNRGIGLLVLHHTRKMDAEDPVDTVSGTLGLAGAADTILVLNRDSHGVTLYGRGRDIEEFKHALTFNKDECRWSLLGNAADVRRGETRQKILDVLAEAGEAMTNKEIARAGNFDQNLVDSTLRRMAKDGEVAKEGRGSWKLPPVQLDLAS